MLSRSNLRKLQRLRICVERVCSFEIGVVWHVKAVFLESWLPVQLLPTRSHLHLRDCGALLLACIGIYGVLAYLTGQRVPEIGVRMTLGATTRDVMRMVLRQSLEMIFVGVAVGILGAVAAGRVLNRLVEGMRPADVSTFAITIAVLGIAARFASFIPPRRANTGDPMD